MIKVEIITPKGIAFSKEVKSVNVPTVEGEIGVLENHMYLLGLLKPGLVYFDGDREKGFVVTYGFVDVRPDKVLILTEEAYQRGEIDLGEAKRLFDEAVKKLAEAKTAEEVSEWERKKEKAQVLMSLAKS